MTQAQNQKLPATVWLGILAAATIVMVVMGIRQSYGIFLPPITAQFGWGREVFALGFAIQMVLMGFGSPVAGLIADRYGAGRVLIAGSLLQAAGLYGVAQASTPAGFLRTAGVRIGFGTSAVSNVVVIGALGRMVGQKRLGSAVGFVMGGGSLGQILMLPAAHLLITTRGWSPAMVMLAFVALLVVPLSLVLVRGQPPRAQPLRQQKAGPALREAGGHSGYLLLTAGFFVCGFHVAFLSVHLPAFAMDQGLDAVVGANALMLIGLFNMIGTNTWGYLGDRFAKKRMLSLIYLSRSVLITGFMLMPVSEVTVYVFSSAMGFIWLGTVPLTSGLVRQIFGAQYLSMLYGVVYMSHQVGGFLGAWLAGWTFDITGSYNVMWAISIGLGIFAAVVHHPIDDRSLESRSLAGSPS